MFLSRRERQLCNSWEPRAMRLGRGLVRSLNWDQGSGLGCVRGDGEDEVGGGRMKVI